MGKASKWLRSFFLSGKKERKREQNNIDTLKPTSTPLPNLQSAPIPIQTPKEKKRWSFRRSTATGGKPLLSPEQSVCGASTIGSSEQEMDQKRHAMAVAVATAAAADAAVAAAQAAAAVIRLTSSGSSHRTARFLEESSAIKIQSAFRGYLARKALCALKGLVKLQALVRGHLVRKQATATLRCMQALITAQVRARAQRMRLAEEGQMMQHTPPPHRRSSPHHPRHRRSYEMDRSAEENIKIVEMDMGEPTRGIINSRSRKSYSISHHDNNNNNNNNNKEIKEPYRYSSYYGAVSPSPSALTEMSPRAYSGHFEDFSFTNYNNTAQSSPQYFSAISVPEPAPAETSYDFPFFPNYMANTESSKAKARSQSAPKQRTDTFERQSSRRRQSIEGQGRNIPRGVKMQRSSSHVGLSANGYNYNYNYQYQYPWSVKLNESSASLKDSECGSTSSVLTNPNYCRSLVGRV